MTSNDPRSGVTPIPDTVIAWLSLARETAFGTWLNQLEGPQQLLCASLRPASSDASFRRYFRIDAAQGCRIIMDAPPEKEDSRPFVRVAELMRGAGLHAPEILAWDEAQGFMLLTDLGAKTMMQMIDRERPEANLALYLQAVDALITWQRSSRPGVLPPYDEALLRRELELFPEWYLTRHRGVQVEGAIRRTLDDMFNLIIAQNLSWPSVFVHRDFMPRNLMVPTAARPPLTQGERMGEGDPRMGVLDFQDAVFGPITYDIASLMRDAFLSWDEAFVLDITVRYWQQARTVGLPVGGDFGEFYRGVEWMGLQRHLKVAGIFARLTLRDGKPQYLADTPRFVHYIRTTASRYRELKPLLRLVDQVEGIADVGGFAFGRF